MPAADDIKAEAQRQQQEALSRQHHNEDRLARVARPLLAAALPLCTARRRSDYGLRLHSVQSYPPRLRDAAQTLYALDQHMLLRQPLPESPAADAGLQAGDRLLRIQGRSLEHRTPDQVQQQLRLESAPVEVMFMRGDKTFSVRLVPVSLCDWPILLSRGSAINAFANGRHIRFTDAMLRYAQKDAELALVVAHELAHNGLEHTDKQLRNLLLGGLLDLLAMTHGYPSPGLAATLGVQRHTQDWEIEADLQALVLLQRAGYKLEEAIEFWRRLGTDFPASIRHSRGLTHPGTAERYLRMKAAARALQSAAPESSPGERRASTDNAEMEKTRLKAGERCF